MWPNFAVVFFLGDQTENGHGSGFNRDILNGRYLVKDGQPFNHPRIGQVSMDIRIRLSRAVNDVLPMSISRNCVLVDG